VETRLDLPGSVVVDFCFQQQVEAAPASKSHVPPLSTLYPKHGLHVADGGAQLKHALISKRSRTSTSTPTPASGAAKGPPSSPPASPPAGRSSAPSSPQPLGPKRRKAVPRRVSTSSSGSGLPGDLNAAGPGAPPEDGDSGDRLAVKQEVEDPDLRDDDFEDVGDQDNEHDGDSRGEERAYYMDSDPDGEAGTSSSLLARSLVGVGASARGVEGAGELIRVRPSKRNCQKRLHSTA